MLDAQGPSPWYLRGTKIETAAGTLTWAGYGKDPVLAGISRLQTSKNNSVLLLDYYCYVRPLAGGRLLVWCEHNRETDDRGTNPFVHFDIIEIHSLKPILDHRGEAERMRKEKRRRFFVGTPLAEFTCFTTLPPGMCRLDGVPSLFKEVEETLVLADYCCEGAGSNTSNQMCRAIYAFNFLAAQVEVSPQDWFNKGGYDFGYQWITRVARDSRTGRIVGEGIRLGSFRLDISARNVEEWLVSDSFYGPRG